MGAIVLGHRYYIEKETKYRHKFGGKILMGTLFLEGTSRRGFILGVCRPYLKGGRPKLTKIFRIKGPPLKL
jgi:hypothetical protein